MRKEREHDSARSYQRLFIYLSSSSALFISLFLLFRVFEEISCGIAPDRVLSVVCIAAELLFAVLAASTSFSVVRGGTMRWQFGRYFIWMLFITTLGLIGDAVSWGVGLDGIRGARVIQAAGTFLSYACSFPLLTIYSVYLISYIDEDEKDLRYYGTLVGGLCLDGLLLVIIAQFLSYDPVAPWSLRDHQWVYFFFLAVPMTVTCAVILIFRKKLSNRNALRFLSYALLVAATVVIDTIVGDVTLAYIAAAYSLFQIYISVQFEYERTQEDELAQQRIAIMLSQIHPHFLYNVLTSIRALCRTAPHKAEQALTEFTIYLRGNLDSLQTRECIPFMQELEHIKHYVDLEKMRFGDDLRVVFATPVTHFYLPPLTVEPLVENAIRHGVMQRRSGGCVAISTAQSSTHYIISVADDGVGFDTDTISSSRRIGLSNVRGRLASICGGRMEISSAPGEGTTVTVLIPKERGEIAP